MAKLRLAVGSFGELVKKLHRKLIEHGVEIPSSEVDRAFFGPATRYAVIQWQRNHGLPASGIVDERTNATLETAPKRGCLRFYFSSQRFFNFLLVPVLKRFVKNCTRIKYFRH